MKDLFQPKFENMREMLMSNLIAFPNSPAIHIKTDENSFATIAYEKFVQDVFSLGTSLINRGYKDKKIAIYGKNSYEWLVSYFAVFCGVGTVVPLDSQLSSSELESALNRVESEAIIYSKDMNKKIEEIKDKTSLDLLIPYDEDKDINVNSLINEGYQLMKEGNRDYLDLKIDSNAPLSLVFTSGTTSEPKIAMLSHKNIAFNVKSVTQQVPVYTWDKFFSILPFNHVLGTLEFSVALSMGASLAICDNLKSIQKDMKTIKPTFMIVVPRVLEMFVNKINKEIDKKGLVGNIANGMAKITNITDRMRITNKRKFFHEIHDNFGGELRIIIVGGAPMNPKDSKRMTSFGIAVRQGYGLTECAPLVTVNGMNDFRHDSVGQPIPGCNVKIANPDKKGIGEVAVQGEQVMLGYYNDPIATAEAIKEDGYLYTGDLGKMNRKRFMKLSGRNKNLIVLSNGKNISPEELETLIGTTDIISEVVITLEKGTNGKDLLTAEFEVAEEIMEEIRNNSIREEEIKKIIWKYVSTINSTTAEYKRIQQIKIRAVAFERTSTLKVKRHAK